MIGILRQKWRERRPARLAIQHLTNILVAIETTGNKIARENLVPSEADSRFGTCPFVPKLERSALNE